MDYSNELYSWLLNVLFIVGIMLVPTGLGFIFFPEKISKLASRLNQWIATDSFFNQLNKPQYQEHYFYRHHRVFGIIIILASLICLYMLTVYINVETITDNLVRLAESEFESWLFVSLYYVLTGAIFLAFIFGLVIIFRPSALKRVERWGNQWVDTDGPLKVLDKRTDLSEKILLGKPRIFGLFVLMGAIYIIWSTKPL